MKERLFKFVEFAARIPLGIGFLVYGLWTFGFIPPSQAVINAHELMLLFSPVVIGAVCVRWVTKWPVPVNWFDLTTALVTGILFVIGLRGILYIYGAPSVFLMKILLPALVPTLSALAVLTFFKGLRDPRRQHPKV